ncbi:MAG TPA: hypothetical protein PKE45_24570, partial [Caldilineaceae bacterium]|nr:hypothetical protein [Caldilineaceae bacterium]
MLQSKSNHSYPHDRFAWAWFVVGALLLPFTAGQSAVPIAVWLAPIFLLRFVRTQRAIVALPLVALAYFAAVTNAFRTSLPFPLAYLAGVVGMVAVLPYGLDRLVGARLNGVARTLVFPLTLTLIDWLTAFGPLGSGMTAAYSQVGNLPLLQIVSVTGVWGLTFLIAWAAPVANELWEQGTDWRAAWPALAIFGGVVLAVLFFGGARLAFATTPSATVRVVGLTHDKALWAELPYGTIEVATGADTLRAAMRPHYARM